MYKDFVPHKPSLELEQLKFDEPCFGWYHDNALEFDVKANKTIELHKLLGRFKDCCLAPTFSQAFRWFREKHNYHHYIEPIHTDGEICYEYCVRDCSYEEWEFDKADFVSTYEEAELLCLIELIKISKYI